MTERVAITGASGELGRRVATRLAERSIPLRLVVRDAERAPHVPGAEVAQAAYHEADAMRAALDGVAKVFIVSAHPPDRHELHATVIEAARSAGVGHIVYLSFLGASPDATFSMARDHHASEERLRSGGVAFTILRPTLYTDLLPTRFNADGVLGGPAGDGRVAWVTRDDIADVVVAVLDGENHAGEVIDVTGPAAMTLDETAQALVRASGRHAEYRRFSPEETALATRAAGRPEWSVEGTVSVYLAIANGEMDVVSDAVPRLAGHDAQSVAAYLDAHPEATERLPVGR